MMASIKIKRIYEPVAPDDGFRVFVDKLWPRGVRKQALRYDLWAKEITPSDDLRRWYHADPVERWTEFGRRYIDELHNSPAVQDFVHTIADKGRVTLLFASKNAAENHALILLEDLQKAIERVTVC